MPDEHVDYTEVRFQVHGRLTEAEEEYVFPQMITPLRGRLRGLMIVTEVTNAAHGRRWSD